MPIIAPIVKMILSEVIKYAFGEFLKKDATNAKVAIVSLYPPIDVSLQNITSKTPSEIDNAVVDGIKEGIEYVANVNDIELPNLDND